MLSKKMEKALNDQVNAELFSAYLYCSMAAYFEAINLRGCAQWMRVQTQEEMGHAAKFFDFIIERGSRVVLQALDKPQTQWKSPSAAFEAALKHEQYITGRINNLVNLAIQEKDHATNSFLKWFVDEQVEEEASVTEIVEKLKMVKNAPGGMFMIDRELGQRKSTGE
jgi:ferritin